MLVRLVDACECYHIRCFPSTAFGVHCQLLNKLPCSFHIKHMVITKQQKTENASHFAHVKQIAGERECLYV